MSLMIMAVLWIVAVIAGQGLPVLTRWLLLRWQIQQEHAYREDLVTVAHALPEGGEIVEEHSDGTWRRLGVTRGQAE